MSKDFDEINPDNIEGEPEGKMLKWMSVLILLLAVGGFFALAWYAYNSGTNQSEVVQAQENLELVEADDTAIKEAPENPGGQQFPHQDKTVFNAISGNEKAPVERILPASEEPVERADNSETETWMNDSIKKDNQADSPSPTEEKSETAPVPTTSDAAQVEPAQQAAPEPSVPVTPFDPSAVKEKAEAVKEKAEAVEAVKPVEEPVKEKSKDVVTRVPAIPVVPVTVDTAEKSAQKSESKPQKNNAEIAPEPKKVSGVRAQLGAFKSQEEAEKNWNVIRAKYASKLEGKEHRVIRVDLGAKGIFYRLHVLPFASAANAQSFCGSIAPQGCFVAGK